MLRRTLITALSVSGALLAVRAGAVETKKEHEKMSKNTVWDKVFAENKEVAHHKVTFRTRFGTEIVADLYAPRETSKKLPAIAVSGPFGAVKEQSSGLYAQELASHGFITLAFDPSFTGESSGFPRSVASPDICTEDFSAAVDYLSNLPEVEKNKIGILGICGWGGFALNAAAIDLRIKATVASTMYNMSEVNTYGYFNKMTEEERYELKKKLNAQRTIDAQTGIYKPAPTLPETLTGNEPQFVKDYWAYYRTPRGFHPRSINSNGAWNETSALSFINTPLLTFADEIRSPVLLVHGEKAHSLYFSQEAFEKLKGDNKRLLIVPGASHTDLYDQKNIIPFGEIISFYKKYLG